MGGSSSKAPTVAAPEFDLNKAKIALPDLQDFQASVQQSAAQANAKLAEALVVVGVTGASVTAGKVAVAVSSAVADRSA